MAGLGEPRYQHRDLREVPEVGATLRRVGLAALVPETVRAAVGRNDNWTGMTTCGTAVFVKRLHGPEADLNARVARLARFESVARSAGLPSPRCLGWEIETAVFVYERVEDARTGAELMVDQAFSPAIAAQVGRHLAAVHATPLVSDPVLDDAATLLPSSRVLRGLPLPLFEASSAAQLQAWSLMQRDSELMAAVQHLEATSAQARPAAAHCDLRVDQLLVSGDRVWLCDWEEFRLADPARDTGSFVGEWLYRAILDIPTTRGDGAGAWVPDLTTASVVERGVARLDSLRPIISAFWDAYAMHRPVDTSFTMRTAAFAGWHLLDRLLAGAMNAARLQPIQRAAAGVGRSVLLQPEKALEGLGLTARTTALGVPA